MMFISILITVMLIILGIIGWLFYKEYQKSRYIKSVVHTLKDKGSEKNAILDQVEIPAHKINKAQALKWKLLQAGITPNDYLQTQIAIYVTALVLAIFPYFFFSLKTAIALTVLAVLIAIFAPGLYLDSAKKERVAKIDHDLSSFLDLIIIMLESGSGLKNALNFVATESGAILSPILINEIKTLENELSNSDSKTAYDNLAKRTGSKYVIAMVDFLKLAEETGMGVKSIFENQAREIKDAEFFEVEKKAATVNLSLTLVVFLFLLPALAAFIILPMRAGGSIFGGF